MDPMHNPFSYQPVFERYPVDLRKNKKSSNFCSTFYLYKFSVFLPENKGIIRSFTPIWKARNMKQQISQY